MVMLDWRLRTAKVVVREWDDSRHVFGPERVFQDGSRWLLYLPENRSDDRVTVEVHGDAVDVSDMWKESPVVVSRTSRSMDVEWRVEGAPLFGPDGNVSRVVKMSFEEEAVLGVHQQWWPKRTLWRSSYRH